MTTSVSNAINLLEKVSQRWEDWASVKKSDIDFDCNYDLNLLDFPEELIFFKNNPVYQDLPEASKVNISAGAWMLFNQVTIALENEIVTPVLLDIIYGRVSGLDAKHLKVVCGQLMTDEAYHTLMVLKSNELTMKARNLNIELNQLEYVQKINDEKSKYSDNPKKQWIVQFAAAVVAEHFNTKAIGILSKDMSFQPLNRLIVEAHWKDELAHNNEFLLLAQIVSATFNTEELMFFKDMLNKPVEWIHSLDVDNWRIILERLKIDNAQVILDGHEEIYNTICQNIDYKKITDLKNSIH